MAAELPTREAQAEAGAVRQVLPMESPAVEAWPMAVPAATADLPAKLRFPSLQAVRWPHRTPASR